jgi:hypothetical protein
VSRGHQGGALAPQVEAATSEGPCGAPLGRLARGLREPATTEQDGQRLRIARVVVGLATVHGWQRKRGTTDAGHPCRSPQVSEPLPGAETRDGHDQGARDGATAWRHGAGAAGLGRGSSLAPSWGTRQTAMLRACQSIPQAKGGMGVASPGRSPLSLRRMSHGQPPIGVCCGGGLNHYHGAAPDCLLRRSRFRQQVSPSVRCQKENNGADL